MQKNTPQHLLNWKRTAPIDRREEINLAHVGLIRRGIVYVCV